MPVILIDDDPMLLGNGSTTKAFGPIDSIVGARTPKELVHTSILAIKDQLDKGEPDFLQPGTLTTGLTELIALDATLVVHNSHTGLLGGLQGHAHITFYPDAEIEGQARP
ncbi:hypothetical protein BDQ17DRAFT_1434604 [Cyathus striatus]|nr:hypothetical protein BDQ17DRAFT_1434604 [Cyathus striatus]